MLMKFFFYNYPSLLSFLLFLTFFLLFFLSLFLASAFFFLSELLDDTELFEIDDERELDLDVDKTDD